DSCAESCRLSVISGTRTAKRRSSATWWSVGCPRRKSRPSSTPAPGASPKRFATGGRVACRFARPRGLAHPGEVLFPPFRECTPGRAAESFDVEAQFREELVPLRMLDEPVRDAEPDHRSRVNPLCVAGFQYGAAEAPLERSFLDRHHEWHALHE